MGYPMRWEEIAEPEVREQPLEEKVERPARLRPYFRRLITFTIAGSIGLVLTVVAGSSLVLNGREPAALRLDAVPSVAAMRVSTPKAGRRVGYVSVTGDIANRSAGKLGRVEVVVDLLDRENRALRTQSAMVARDLLAPGESSTYQLVMPDDQRATAYRVHFRKLYGAPLQ